MAPSVPVTVEATAWASVERAFDVIAPIDLASIFTGFGPLPGVVRVRDVEAADGAWWFTAAPGSTATAIRWTYAFRPRSRRGAAPVVRLFVAPLWRAYARRVLARAVGAAEHASVR